jgi:hypothetical protein
MGSLVAILRVLVVLSWEDKACRRKEGVLGINRMLWTSACWRRMEDSYAGGPELDDGDGSLWGIFEWRNWVSWAKLANQLAGYVNDTDQV